MGKRRDTTAANGNHWTASTRRNVRRSRSIAYPDTSYNPVSGLEPSVVTGHEQRKSTNTLNNRRNGGGAMYDNTFKREGRAG